MEKSRRNLKIYSIIVLALAGLSLLNIIFELFFGELNRELNNATIPEGAPVNTVLIAQIFVLVVSLLLILPQIYIGIKGIRIAKKPDSSSGHIVWGIILLVFTVIDLFAPFLALIAGDGDAFGNIAEICSIVADVIILFEYVRCARAVKKGI